MKRFIWSCCLVSAGFLLAPVSSFSAHLNVGCGNCHDDYPDDFRQCIICHDGITTLEVATHSSEVIGSDKYAPWGRECLDCHNPHKPNNFFLGIPDEEHPVVGILDEDMIKVEFTVNYAVASGTEVTFNLENVNVRDSAWANPATWPEKSGPGRGLLLVIHYNDFEGYVYYEVIGTTATSVTIGENYRMFPGGNNPINAQLIYGMLIWDEVNGIPVKAAGPSFMANDESGDGTDETPNGICQVCHTQTTHWRNDGLYANHFSGWKCTICHPHEEGFRPIPPSLCLIENDGPQEEWDCSGTWGGDSELDNCGTCDNDPSNDCLVDCNGVWGGDGQLDACGVCDGDSTVYPDGSPCDLADRTGTVTIAATGLMWQQDTTDVNNDGVRDTGDKLLFDDAVDYCNNLLFAGYPDWRLPTKDELKGLVLCVDSSGNTTTVTPLIDGQYCTDNYIRPTIDQSNFDSITGSHWSIGPDYLWITNFLHGRTWITANGIPYYLRCVRDVTTP